jgi:cytochrome c553
LRSGTDRPSAAERFFFRRNDKLVGELFTTKDPAMKDKRENKASRAGIPVQSGKRTKPVHGDCGCALLLALLFVMAGVSQAAFAGDTGELFLKNCAACHGKDGKAQTSVARKLGVKDLTQSKLTDAQIEQQIREGTPATQSSAKMPAFKDRLTAEEIKSLIPVVKEFRK